MADSNPNPTEEGFKNATRHEHELFRSEELTPYKCNGCKEFGGNVVYKCKFQDSCHNFTLHEACATVPDVFQHPWRGLLHFRPKTLCRHHCDACGDVLKGFVFETERHHVRRELSLHPLCMVLPQTLQYSGHTKHRLVMNDLEVDAYNCNACHNKIHSGGWRYRCEERTCSFNVDLSCAKLDIYRLSVPRIAPISRSRKVMSKLSKPAKFIAKGLFGIGLQLLTGEILNEMAESNNDLSNNNRNTDNEMAGRNNDLSNNNVNMTDNEMAGRNNDHDNDRSGNNNRP